MAAAPPACPAPTVTPVAAASAPRSPTPAEQLQVLNGFLVKADGKDKLTALIQYTCMFLSANEPGKIKKIQASVTAARKVFRVFRPLESLTPIILQPGFTGKQPQFVEAANKLKALLMAIYFGADHVVWAYQIGLTTDKNIGERYQKLSLWSWALGSLCTVATEVYSIGTLAVPRKEGEDDEAYAKRMDDIQKQVNQRLFVLLHAVVQALTAAGLLQVLPFKPRTVGLLGMIASAMNCWMLLPPLPKTAATVKAKEA